jgi:enoyl reductase-like protein
LELGEPVHKIVTWATKLWKELDDTVFKKIRSLLKEGRAYWETEQGLCETMVWMEEEW